MSSLERRLREAFDDAAAAPGAAPNPDLFARVARSVEADRERRRTHLRWAGTGAGAVLALAALGVALSDYDNGRFRMPWWVLELITTIALFAVAAVLGPFIKRFGRGYAADVFRANPRTGKSYLVLTDVAYYLIFLAYIMFTSRFEPAGNWTHDVGAEQVHHEVVRVGGILLLLGILHSVNIVLLPIIGHQLSINRRLDEPDPPSAAPSPAARPSAAGPSTSTPAGTGWVLRIEPFGPPDPGVDET